MAGKRTWVNNVVDGTIAVLCLPLGIGIVDGANTYLHERSTVPGTPAKVYEKPHKQNTPAEDLRIYPHNIPFNPWRNIGKPAEKIAEFPYRNEEDVIFKTAERVGVPAENLFAIRKAENGGKDREFGIIPNNRYRNDIGIDSVPYDKLFEHPTFLKQASWCARTVKNRMNEWDAMTSKQKAVYKDFVDYLGDTYCPEGADNDPHGLNAHWEPNVREVIREYSKEGVLAALRKQSQSRPQ